MNANLALSAALSPRRLPACVAQRAYACLSSLGLSVTTLIGLFVLTWFGTLYQVEHGLWAAQEKYFESFVLLQHLGDLWVSPDEPEWVTDFPLALPLPGGLTLMGLLGLNLLIGGGVRIVQGIRTGTRVPQRIGVLVVHAGMAVLLASGLVKTATGIEGSITLYEGDTAHTFQSFHDWEMVVQRQESDGQIEEMVVPGAELFALSEGDRLRIGSHSLPFEVEVLEVHRHCEPVRRGGGHGSFGHGIVGQQSTPVATGFALKPLPVRIENAQNFAGCRVVLRGDLASGDRTEILWGGDRSPLTVETRDGSLYGLRLRKETHPLPFSIRLEEFRAEMYPGTRKPRSFESDVTVLDEGNERRVRVEMNEPLRKGDLVVYQSSWGPQNAGPDARLFSGFQVVVNPADQWPLWGCIVTAIGMLIVFGAHLLRFLGREAKKKRVAPVAGLLVAGLVLSGGVAAQGHGSPVDPSKGERGIRSYAWPESVLEIAARLPVQHDGRIKPLQTQMHYLLMRCNGRSTVQVPDEARFGAARGETLDSVAWALDALVFPSLADRYPIFLVQTSEVLDAIEVDHGEKSKRDRYSFRELKPGLARLFELSAQYGHIEDKERTGLEEQIVALARNVADYDRLVRSFDPARIRFVLDDAPALKLQLGTERPFVRYSGLLTLRDALMSASRPGALDEGSADRQALDRILSQTQSLGRDGVLLRWIPPVPEEPTWWTAPELFDQGVKDVIALHVQALHELLIEQREDSAAVSEVFESLDRLIGERLAERNEGEKLAEEVSYLNADPTYRSLLAFVFAFVLVAVSWLKPKSRKLAWPALGATCLGLGLLIHGIVWRCLLRERPPITGLYDTILFVVATIVAVSLLVERVQRKRIFLSLAALLGMLGMFLARRFEAIEARDTMPTLIAVLDTNFWLATHVTIINLGYAGALLCGFIAHVFVVGHVLGLREKHRAFFDSVARATYGVCCFATLFTTVGTILGGIWANDSWGRFWGWDPKENGALMIVLWNLVMLHMRLANQVKALGFAVLAVAGNAVVVFSWFHTNLLGVGLHSYGFSGGLAAAVWSFYAVEFAVVALGLYGLWRQRRTQLA